MGSLDKILRQFAGLWFLVLASCAGTRPHYTGELNIPLTLFLILHFILLLILCLTAWNSWRRVKAGRKRIINGENWFDYLHRAEIIYYRNRATLFAAIVGEAIFMVLLYLAGIFDLLF